jgi:transcriptional regulator with XRE-family HTH domain
MFKGRLNMVETLGDKIKQLRKQYSISQEALAYNICTQSEISRIENNKHTPSHYILLKVAERFGISINYFFEDSSGGLDYISEVKYQLKISRRNRDYQTIYEIIQTEENNPLFKEELHIKYLLWHKGIVHFHLFKDSKLAI